ncbi:MAG: hypothetical protein ACF8PN_04045 [Phycisphaerales bacterium]
MLTRIGAAAIAAGVVAASPVHADITLSDFSDFELSGVYEDWGFGTFTPGPTDYRVEATNFGGGWLFLDAPIDASGEDLVEVVVTANPANVTTAFNVVLFSGAGTTQAGFRFEISPGTQTLTADLNNPDFFNAGDINSWDTSDIWDQWHIQGTFENSDPLDLTFDNLALITAGGGDPTLSVDGVCPGVMTFTAENMTPDGNVAFIYAFGTGSQTIPAGNPCAGTQLGLDRSAQLGATQRADGSGVAVVMPNVPAAACGRVFIQALDLSSCGTTNVVGL